jgi:2,4-didehydro-3-deoxy-L-rhamnonate hydrolase
MDDLTRAAATRRETRSSDEVTMKLLRFGAPGKERPGLVDSAGVIRDLGGVVDDIAGDVLAPASLARLAALRVDTLPAVPADVRIGPCVGRVGKFICIGLNYSDHAAESKLPVPAEPVVFGKWTSAIVGPNDDIEIPRGSTRTDWEVELGVVIGRTCRYVDEADAMSYVAGYCVIHDVSEREFQLDRGGTWDKGKGCDTFGPLGPWLVTADEVADPHALRLWLEVDGRRYQDGNTARLIFRIPTLISYLSGMMSLHPGDVISTGTPAGVGLGQQPPIYLRPGNVVRLGIDGLGEQRQRVRAWPMTT